MLNELDIEEERELDAIVANIKYYKNITNHTLPSVPFPTHFIPSGISTPLGYIGDCGKKVIGIKITKIAWNIFQTKPLIKMTDIHGNWIQWVNDAQAAMLEQEFPGQIQWK